MKVGVKICRRNGPYLELPTLICLLIMPFNVDVKTAQQRDHYSAIRWLVHWPLMGGLLHLVQQKGAWVNCIPPSPLIAVPIVTANPSMASVPTSYYSMWHYNCGLPVPTKGLKTVQDRR